MAEVIDWEAIIDARIRGQSARAVARRFGITMEAVEDVVNRYAVRSITHRLRFNTFAFTLERLEAIYEAHEAASRAGDAASSAILLKVIERQQVLLGLPQPARTDQMLIDAQAQPARTSTERFRAVIERLYLEHQKPEQAN
jgi:hypothetical protein